jgi:hypothetical protein
MKKLLKEKILALIGVAVAISATCVHAQSGNWDPYVHSMVILPAPLLPLEFSGKGVISLKPGNNGGDELPLGSLLNSNDLMVVTFSLANGVPDVADPSDEAQALSVLGGPGKVYWDWTYNPFTLTYRGVQNRPIPAYTAEEVTVPYRVTANTFQNASPGTFNGLNVNISPPGYTSPQTTANDQGSSYTYVSALDYGDAPSTYGEAQHLIDLTKDGGGFYNNYMYLGSRVDPEAAYQASANALGDDSNQTGGLGADDEDGVTFPALIPGSTVTIPVVLTIADGDQTGYIGRLNAWFDWNGDGDFLDSGERVATNTYVDYDILGGGSSGTLNLQVTVPANATPGQTFARFRFGPSLLAPVNTAPFRSVAFGEVEDYPVTIQGLPATVGNRVWEDLDGDGVQDTGEPGMTNITVRLLDASSNTVHTTVTDLNGEYSFTNLLPSTYLVQVVPRAQYIFTLRDSPATNNLADSDMDASGYSQLFTLASGVTDLSWDAGLTLPARIYGHAFLDLNTNLVRTVMVDYPIANMTVTLWRAGVQIASTLTAADGSGQYAFNNLIAGGYTVRFSGDTNQLVAVPGTAPALTDPERNRAAVDGLSTISIAVSVVPGEGVTSATEPRNAGFIRPERTLSESVSIRAYAAADGVRVEITTAGEAGYGMITLWVWLDGAWVGLGSTPSMGFGSNTYSFNAPGLEAGKSYYFKVEDEVGYLYDLYDVRVQPFATEMQLMERAGVRLKWDSIPGRAYKVYTTKRLGDAWIFVDVVWADSDYASLDVLNDPQDRQRFFKIVMVRDEVIE